MNFTSLFEAMDLGTPCRRIISLKNRLATYIASIVYLQERRCAILEYLSITTSIKSDHFLSIGNSRIKFINISSQMPFGIGKKNVYHCLTNSIF